MRSHPIGTGPFKFVEFKPNEVDQGHQKPGLLEEGPALSRRHRVYDHQEPVDGGHGVRRPARSTLLRLISCRSRCLKDVKSQAPEAICELMPSNVNRNVMFNREAPPFNNPELLRAAGAQRRPQGLYRHPDRGQGRYRRRHAAAAGRVWGMPPDMLKTLPGYDPDVPKNRAEARKIMEKLGYGPDKRLADHGVDAQRPALPRPGGHPDRPVEGDLHRRPARSHRHRAMAPQGHAQGLTRSALNLTGNGLDDPDQTLYENFTCGAEGNYDGYCNPELDKMVDRQSMEFDQAKRKELVWAIERKLAEDAARPILYHSRSGTCWQPYVKGYTPMINSIYNGLRMEDVWLDK